MELSDMVIREIVSVYTNDLEWEHYQRKNRPYSGFCLKLTGSTIYHCDGKDYLSDNTHLIVIPQNTSYDYTILEKGKCVVVDFIADNDAVGIRSLRIRNSSLFKSIASSMQYAWSFKRVGYREICLSYAYQLLYQAVVCENEEYIASSLEKRIENGTLYLSQHYCDHALTIQKLAELSDTSEIYFRKLFTKICFSCGLTGRSTCWKRPISPSAPSLNRSATAMCTPSARPFAKWSTVLRRNTGSGRSNLRDLSFAIPYQRRDV